MRYVECSTQGSSFPWVNQPLMAKLPVRLGVSGLEEGWEKGIYLGKKVLTDEFLVQTSNGVLATRSVKVLPQALSEELALFQAGRFFTTCA